MNNAPKNASVEGLYRAVGSALSTWSLVELHLYQIFTITLSLTVPQNPRAWSSSSQTPTAVLDAIDGWRVKLEVVDAAVASALQGLDEEAVEILNTWALVRENINDLHQCRSKLAHWRAESLRQKVRLAPPFHRNPPGSDGYGKEGAWESDINRWQTEFARAASRLAEITVRLANHKGLQRRFVEQAANQIRPLKVDGQLVGGDPTFAEFLIQQLSEHR